MNASDTGVEEDDGVTEAMERAFESLTFACAVPFEGGVAAVADLVPPEEISEDAGRTYPRRQPRRRYRCVPR